ncbi:arsenate reductase [Roseovarius faecimaris]|uniref:Arsenate reductase n=1 Tax=Roseovarius faecimaris TaxID=2494550 RepID=A0A6I6IQQ0_9RHOB|nr:ArsC/Spx/MgsR family protein [Roseovarius faecimaris]QGX97837.1 arsenate reductase [Roseovarius faecimaris]
MILYGLKSCDTCRKALKSLPEATFVDVRAEGVPDQVLKSAYADLGSALLNTRSTTWRELSDEARGQEPIELLKAHPTVMKRPLIEADGRFYLGWTKATQEALLN